MKLYSIYNKGDGIFWPDGYFNYTSTDRSLLEEIICDAFMNDIIEHFSYAALNTRAPISFYAKLVWQITLDIYNDNIEIYETELI